MGANEADQYFDGLVTDVNRWDPNPSVELESQLRPFQLHVPERFNMSEAAVGRHARGGAANQVALIDTQHSPARQLTFEELDREASRCAAFLRALGVERGQVVVCYASQGMEAALTHLAAYKLGAVIAPLSLLYGRDTLRHAIRDSGASIVVSTRTAWDALAGLGAELNLKHLVIAGGATGTEVDFGDYAEHAPLDRPVETNANDPALLLYTSGSTGLPKGILHAHRLLLGYLASVSMFYELQMREAGQVLWTPSDWSWIAGIVNVQLTGWFFGHTVVAGQSKFSAEWAFEFIARHGITHTFLTPTALKRMAEIENPRLRWPHLRLRAIGTGGEPCPSALLAWGEDSLQVPINEFYGLTEVNHLIGNCRHLYPIRPGSMGKSYPGHRIAIIDENGNPLPAGATGQIAAHKSDPTLFLGYWNQPERTQAMYLGEWVLTGDYARVDSDGYFWYAGRNDDLIKSAGYRIGPAEVEDTLVRHPAVAEAGVVGIPDPDRGQIVKAFVRLVDGYLPSRELADDLRRHVKANLASYKFPRLIEFVDNFPLTTTGKISRKELRNQPLASTNY
ncbi:MAG: AMP-binding protein [Burkholderiaceae bacterium]|nr:AMP-binding protein [Burkholderiaceae bacterium]